MFNVQQDTRDVVHHINGDIPVSKKNYYSSSITTLLVVT